MRRTPFFVALALLSFAFLLEVGGGFLVTPDDPDDSVLRELLREEIEDDADREAALAEAGALARDRPPGYGIRSLALIDGLLLLSLGLLALAMFVPHDVHGRLVGAVSLAGGFVVAVLAVLLLVAALTSVTLMIALLLSSPFGTITYVARYGFFDRGTAGTLLGLALLAKIGFVAFAVSAYPRFLREKGLLALTATSFGTLLLVSFLHGLVPRVLVSILDAVAAIVVAIVAIVWAVVLMVGSLTSILRVLRVRRG